MSTAIVRMCKMQNTEQINPLFDSCYLVAIIE